MDVDYHVADEDLALAVVPGSNFNPKTRSNPAKTVGNFYFRENRLNLFLAKIA
jgi:hypothetical protein